MPKINQAVLNSLRTFPDGASAREVWDRMDASDWGSKRYSRHSTRGELELIVKEHLATREKDVQTRAVVYTAILPREGS